MSLNNWCCTHTHTWVQDWRPGYSSFNRTLLFEQGMDVMLVEPAVLMLLDSLRTGYGVLAPATPDIMSHLYCFLFHPYEPSFYWSYPSLCPRITSLVVPQLCSFSSFFLACDSFSERQERFQYLDRRVSQSTHAQTQEQAVAQEKNRRSVRIQCYD